MIYFKNIFVNITITGNIQLQYKNNKNVYSMSCGENTLGETRPNREKQGIFTLVMSASSLALVRTNSNVDFFSLSHCPFCK